MTTLEFWQAIYVAAIRGGNTGFNATNIANAAIAQEVLLRAELASGTP
jgi:hypothetical protein